MSPLARYYAHTIAAAMCIALDPATGRAMAEACIATVESNAALLHGEMCREEMMPRDGVEEKRAWTSSTL